MALQVLPLSGDTYADFSRMMKAYYQETIPQELPADVIDGYIQNLYRLVLTNDLRGGIAADGEVLGFALWEVDASGAVYSELPGYGTILELGIQPEYRGRGYGRQLTEYVQGRLLEEDVIGFYVCADETSREFWEKCGYRNVGGRTASNGLPMLLRGIV